MYSKKFVLILSTILKIINKIERPIATAEKIIPNFAYMLFPEVLIDDIPKTSPNIPSIVGTNAAQQLHITDIDKATIPSTNDAVANLSLLFILFCP